MIKGILTIAVLGSIALQTAMAAPLHLDFAGTGTSKISFGGDSTFNFTPNAAGHYFQVNDTQNGADKSDTANSAVGLMGDLTGTFTIGPVSNVPGGETATVTGLGNLSIFDGSTPANAFTATVDWKSIKTVDAFGGLNYLADVNLSNFSYGGTNADLLSLLNSGAGIVTATFQFTTPTLLDTLVSTHTTTSYSGSIAATPEPGFYGLTALGLASLTFVIRRRRTA